MPKEKEDETFEPAEESGVETWFDYWATTFQGSIEAILGASDDTVEKINAKEVIDKAREIADLALGELQYKHTVLGMEESEKP